MTTKAITTLFSRILFSLGGALTVVFAYYLVQTALAPVEVPRASPPPKNAAFDPALDVTKNETFGRLHPVGPSDIQVGITGRSNPFLPAPTSTTEARGELQPGPGTVAPVPISSVTSGTSVIPAAYTTTTR